MSENPVYIPAFRPQAVRLKKCQSLSRNYRQELDQLLVRRSLENIQKQQKKAIERNKVHKILKQLRSRSICTKKQYKYLRPISRPRPQESSFLEESEVIDDCQIEQLMKMRTYEMSGKPIQIQDRQNLRLLKTRYSIIPKSNQKLLPIRSKLKYVV